VNGSSVFDGTEPGGVLAPELGPGAPRRALVMAGGGLKVAFQAGALQVWLDEARAGGEPLRFDHADGASGGVYNLAMWCQGMTGREIADNWRRFSPVPRGLGPNWRRGWRGESLLTMSRFRKRTLRELWGLDWEKIQATDRSAGFNVFDVHDQQLVTLPPQAMTEDHLVAATSLPMWYPPVPIRGRNYIDGVWVTDANLDAAIDAGANELWIVWTVSTRGRWRNGPVAQYFQIIEACANGRLRRDLDRIARSNRAHAEGRHAEYPYPIRVRALQREVPMHYLMVFRRKAVVAAVEQGVRAARDWCAEEGIDLAPGDRAELGGASAGVGGRGVEFREKMTGPVAFGVGSARDAADVGTARADRMALRLDVRIADLAAFLADPEHVARVSGSMDCPLLGGTRPVRGGTLALLPQDRPGAGSTMEYRLPTTDGTGRALLLVGRKTVRNDAGPDLWADTTTLDLEVHEPGGTDRPLMRGLLQITPLAFLKVLLSVSGRRIPAFTAFFLRRLVRLYVLDRPAVPAAAPAPGLADWPDGLQPAGAAVFVHDEHLVPASPERTWGVLRAAGSWSSYYPNARKVRVEGGGDLRDGTNFRWTTFGFPGSSTVTAFDEADGRMGWTWRSTGARGYHLWSLRPDPAGTRVVTEETQRGPRPRLAAPVLRRVMHIGHRAWLRGLARTAAQQA
jgi:predicted acylesterase/phospholipase RssA